MTTQEDPHILAPDHLPTPFTAAEIRDASPPGLAVTVVREAEGQPPTVSVTRFVDGDEEGSTRERQVLTADGEPAGEPARARATWLDLQAHASFPSATTARTEEAIDTPMGRLACLRYDVVEGDSRQTFWFARTLPGMPVRVERWRDGRLDELVVMTEHRT